MKITPEVLSLLHQVANDLPPITKPEVSRRIKGSTLIENGVKTTKDGEDILPDKYYEYLTKSDTDHIKAMTRIFKKKGTQGIEEYKKQQEAKAIELIRKKSNTPK